MYFELPLFLGKMAACPSSGKLEQQRGSTMCFHYVSRPLVENYRASMKEVNENELLVPTRSCFFLCLMSACFRPAWWQVTVHAKTAFFRPSVRTVVAPLIGCTGCRLSTASCSRFERTSAEINELSCTV